MGAYLSAPVTHKDHFEGSSVDVIYGGASMQVRASTLHIFALTKSRCNTIERLVCKRAFTLFNICRAGGGPWRMLTSPRLNSGERQVQPCLAFLMDMAAGTCHCVVSIVVNVSLRGMTERSWLKEAVDQQESTQYPQLKYLLFLQ